MQVLSSYGVELRKQNIPIHQTLEIYRSAVSYLTEIYGQVWEELEQISDSKRCKLCLNGMPVPLLRNCYSIFNGTKYR